MRGTAAKGTQPGGASARVDEQRLATLIGPTVAATGMELESLKISRAGRRLLVRVVVDSDNGVTLDDAADVSRAVSQELDVTDIMGDHPYTLEVSSPGVDRPLTEPKHWRRATGRLVKVALVGQDGQPSGEQISGRLVAADGDGVTVDDDGQQRSYGYSELGSGSIEVEFGRLGKDSADVTEEET
jgi:ribosome maturation factor RimP